MMANNQQIELLGKIAAYTELLVKDPRSTIFVSLAEAYRKMGLLEDAKQIVAKGLEYHANYSPAHIVLARIDCQLENFDASRIGFERALSLDPDSLAALVGYARLNLMLERHQQARSLLLRARNISPADPVINKMLLSLPPQPAEERDSATQTVAESSSKEGISSLVSTTLADLYLKQGFKDKALLQYRQLLQKNPDNQLLRNKISEIEGDAPVTMEQLQPKKDTTLDILNGWLENIRHRKTLGRTYV